MVCDIFASVFSAGIGHLHCFLLVPLSVKDVCTKHLCLLTVLAPAGRLLPSDELTAFYWSKTGCVLQK